MKRIGILTIFLVSLSFYVSAQGVQTSMEFAPSPRLIQKTTTLEVTLKPVYYPDIYKFSEVPDSQKACAEYVKNELSGKPLNTASVCDQGCGGGHYGERMGPIDGDNNPIYVALADLSIEVPIKKGYEKTSQLLVTWTVRIEGYKPNGYLLAPRLCKPFYGYSWQRFGEGEAKTALFVKYPDEGYKKLGEDITMTVPGAGEAIVRDPTQTGSYLITPDDFGGKLPSVVELQIRWKNQSSMIFKSPAGMSNLIVEVLPLDRSFGN